MTSVTLTKLSFIVQIYVAELLLTHNLKKSRFFLVKISVCILLSLAIAYFFPMFFYNAVYSSFTFFCLFSLTILCLTFCLKESFVNILFCGIAAYTFQHLSYQVGNLIITCCFRDLDAVLGNYANELITEEKALWLVFYESIRYLCCYTVYWGLYVLYGKKIATSRDFKIKNKKVLFLVAIGFFVDVILNSIVVYMDLPEFFGDYAITYNVIIFISTGLCCLLLLNVQFGLIEQRATEAELEVLKHLWEQKTSQFEIAQENIDIINQKCHDMKHQIKIIGQGQQINEKVIKEMTQAISIYDSCVKTGNDALDTVLTEKSLICSSNGILFNCVVDGQKVSFMDTSDIYVLFGNAVDNAIEAVLKLSDLEKRVIDLVIYAKGNLLTINLMNAYSGTIIFDKGLPVTTKENKYYHGFGMKGIKAIVDKYGGDLSLSTSDEVFSMAILLPIKIKTAD